MPHSLRYTANCSMLFTELPLLERPAAARGAGFDAVEFWWPWPEDPVPTDRQVDAFVGAITDAGVRLSGLNFFAGDLAGPDCGVLSVPGRAAAFVENLPVALAIGERLGTAGFNALYGARVDGVDPVAQDELGVENLVLAAGAVAAIGATVLIEPLSGPKPYPLRTAENAMAVVGRVRAAGADNVGLLCDLYHLVTNADDLDRVIDQHGGDIAHVQVADAPGRGEPGSGSLDLDHYLRRLEAAGYHGLVGLEYKPTRDTVSSLAWMAAG